MRTTASDTRLDAPFLDERGQTRQHRRIRLRQHAVPEVEDVRAMAGRIEDVERRFLDALPRPEQQCGVEVSLHRVLLGDGVERETPVDADGIAARARETAQQL